MAGGPENAAQTSAEAGIQLVKDMPVLMAFVLGALSQLSLVISAVTVFLARVPTRLVGAMAAFGAGALIAAVARDLLPEVHELALWQSSLWAMIGAGAIITGEHIVEKKFGTEGPSAALGIVVGAIVDGVPESIIFGIQLASGAPISAAFIAAVFVSNIPQAIAPSADLAAAGWSWRRVCRLWSWVVLTCGTAAIVGYLAGRATSSINGARMAAFAAGGILAMVSNSLLPFAQQRSKGAGLWTVVGFCSSFAMAQH
jgi:ZIP family zinc transporter